MVIIVADRGGGGVSSVVVAVADSNPDILLKVVLYHIEQRALLSKHFWTYSLF